MKESLLCTRNVSKFLPYCGSHMHDPGASFPSQYQPLKPEDFQQEGSQTTLEDLCPSPLYWRKCRSVPCQTLGQAASLWASPKRLQLLSSDSPTSRTPKTTSTIYLDFRLAFFRCISLIFGNTHTTTECLCEMVRCGGLDAAWKLEWAAIETPNPLLPFFNI